MDKAKHILFVEDEPLSRWVVRKGLENAGYFVVEADCCAKGMALLDTACFDMVVLDHRLPDGVGLDILRRLRAGGKNQKVIYLTAEPEEINDSLKRELAIAVVLSKPVDMAELVRALGAPVEAAPSDGAAHKPAEIRVGRFTLLKAPETMDAGFLKEALAAAATESWLAIDLAQTVGIKPQLAAEFYLLADKCRAGGGRLCMVGGSEEIRALLRASSLRDEADFYPDSSWLEPAGRRPSSDCERGLLLKSVIAGGSV